MITQRIESNSSASHTWSGHVCLVPQCTTFFLRVRLLARHNINPAATTTTLNLGLRVLPVVTTDNTTSTSAAGASCQPAGGGPILVVTGSLLAPLLLAETAYTDYPTTTYGAIAIRWRLALFFYFSVFKLGRRAHRARRI